MSDYYYKDHQALLPESNPTCPFVTTIRIVLCSFCGEETQAEKGQGTHSSSNAYSFTTSVFKTVTIILRPMKVNLLVAQWCLTLCDPVDCSRQGPLSTEFSRQEYWSGLPFSSQRDLLDPWRDHKQWIPKERRQTSRLSIFQGQTPDKEYRQFLKGNTF